MEVILLSKEEYENIIRILTEINLTLATFKKGLRDMVIDNEEFIKVMRISKRTAQNWRDEGIITFSQVGSKIYYNIGDIDEMMKKYLKKSFYKK